MCLLKMLFSELDLLNLIYDLYFSGKCSIRKIYTL